MRQQIIDLSFAREVFSFFFFLFHFVRSKLFANIFWFNFIFFNFCRLSIDVKGTVYVYAQTYFHLLQRMHLIYIGTPFKRFVQFLRTRTSFWAAHVFIQLHLQLSLMPLSKRLIRRFRYKRASKTVQNHKQAELNPIHIPSVQFKCFSDQRKTNNLFLSKKKFRWITIKMNKFVILLSILALCALVSFSLISLHFQKPN